MGILESFTHVALSIGSRIILATSSPIWRNYAKLERFFHENNNNCGIFNFSSLYSPMLYNAKSKCNGWREMLQNEWENHLKFSSFSGQNSKLCNFFSLKILFFFFFYVHLSLIHAEDCHCERSVTAIEGIFFFGWFYGSFHTPYFGCF